MFKQCSLTFVNAGLGLAGVELLCMTRMQRYVGAWFGDIFDYTYNKEPAGMVLMIYPTL